MSQIKVNIEDLGMDLGMNLEVKSRGIEFKVREPGGKHIGDLYLTNTKLIWCQGKTTRDKGKSITWKKFIRLIDES